MQWGRGKRNHNVYCRRLGRTWHRQMYQPLGCAAVFMYTLSAKALTRIQITENGQNQIQSQEIIGLYPLCPSGRTSQFAFTCLILSAFTKQSTKQAKITTPLIFLRIYNIHHTCSVCFMSWQMKALRIMGWIVCGLRVKHHESCFGDGKWESQKKLHEHRRKSVLVTSNIEKNCYDCIKYWE